MNSEKLSQKLHTEMMQDQINAKRQELKKSLSESERNRLEAMEKASALLETAGVPFFLCGDMKDSGASLWRFQKLYRGEIYSEECMKSSSDYIMPLLRVIIRYIEDTFPTLGVGIRFLYKDAKPDFFATPRYQQLLQEGQ